MGSNHSVQINIHLDRANSFYFAGETVSGTINVRISAGQIKLDEILLLLAGESGYTTTHTVTDSNGSTSVVINYLTKSFLKTITTIESPSSEQKKLIYNPGSYSWHFDIPLPSQLPPSLNLPQSYPHVRYYLKLVMDKPWYKRNATEILYLTVFPRMDLLHDAQLLTPTLFSDHNRNDVTLKGTIHKLAYLPGETITGTLEIINPRRSVLKQIKLLLIQHYKIECNTKQEKLVDIILPIVDHRNDEYIMDKFSLTVPSIPLPPSYDFHDGYDHKTHVNIHYNLEFQVKIEGMFTNFDIPVPITIASISDMNSNNYEPHRNMNFSQNSLSYYPEIDIDDKTNPPPSYDSIVFHD
ncbi:unnamed protein product [Adineta ricciae]|uniref:Arrestin C-terminal-like domain-containing protein n=1 Tax=Adineta ricciae TaxID=249248 RepID=A0A814SIA4_ADIRI|nr:unnamed protein product [Adineta ricciae]CAF1148653.1 unnamed protein product [Adineta ricciae]